MADEANPHEEVARKILNDVIVPFRRVYPSGASYIWTIGAILSEHYGAPLAAIRDRLETALNLYADADMPQGLRSALALIVQDLSEITGEKQ
jgi:hypothetical protein